MIDFEFLRRSINRENAAQLLAGIPCPYCGECGNYQLFDEINNNGVGIRCLACDKHHPFVRERIMWLRSSDNRQRPSNDIIAVAKQCGNYCYFCGEGLPELLARGVGAAVHHTRRFCEFREQYAKIPVCSECHELANFMQRLRQRQRSKS